MSRRTLARAETLGYDLMRQSTSKANVLAAREVRAEGRLRELRINLLASKAQFTRDT